MLSVREVANSGGIVGVRCANEIAWATLLPCVEDHAHQHLFHRECLFMLKYNASPSVLLFHMCKPILAHPAMNNVPANPV